MEQQKNHPSKIIALIDELIKLDQEHIMIWKLTKRNDLFVRQNISASIEEIKLLIKLRQQHEQRNIQTI